MTRVLILGGGFGGIAAAVALRERLPDDAQVVLVDRREEFVMGLRKTWYILGISPLAYGERPLAQLGRRGIDYRHAEITAIDPGRLTATLDGEVVEADAMVVALGARHAPEEVPGLAERGLNCWTREGLERVMAGIDGFRAGRAVVGVFGQPYSCPPAPYELALLLADRLQDRGIDADLSVFTPAPITLPIVGASGCVPLDGRLAERGIAFLPGRVAEAVEDGVIRFTDGATLPFDLLLAVPPHRVPSVLVEAGLASAQGWVRVDRQTLETGHDGVYAIGDCTAIGLANGMPLPKAGLFAQKEGETVAARIEARLRGEDPTATFDGAGACFIEMGGGDASMVRGDFYADPPAAVLTQPSHDQREEKERFEADRLEAWFGG